MSSSSMIELRRRLEGVQSPAFEAPPLRVGVRALDEVLGVEGIARGQLTAWCGAASSGKTALLQAAITQTRRWGHAVAYIDAARALMPADWTQVAPGLLWMLRPPRPNEAVFCAEVLLRTGCFSLVVLDGAPPLTSALTMRLRRLARRCDAALVVLSEAAPTQRRCMYIDAPPHIGQPSWTRRGPLARSVVARWQHRGRAKTCTVPVVERRFEGLS